MLKFNNIAPKQISRILLWHILGFIWMTAFTLRHSKVTFSDGSFWLLSHESRGLVRNLISRFLKQMPSIIRQKGKSSNGCFKKIKHAKFSEKRSFLTPWHADIRFFWNTRFEIRALALSPIIPGIWGRLVNNHLEIDVKNSVKFRKLAPTEGVEEDWMRRLHVRGTY